MLAHCHWQTDRSSHPAIILLHGLEGSSHAHYMVGISDKAWAAGWNVVRLNQRNCGNTEHLSRGLYHSGLTHDALFVMRELIERDRIRSIAIAGYSLGGNLALKLAGELGESAPPELAAVCAVSPTMDLARCVDALERRSNFVYQWNFVRNLKARMRRKAAAIPGAFSLDAAAPRLDRARIRRGLYGAASRLPRRRRLLPSRERAARHRTHSRSDADHHRRGRSVRAGRAIPRTRGRRQSEHHARHHRRTAAIAPIWNAPPETTTAAGPSGKSCGLRKRSDQLARKLRPLPGFFVLEVDVDVAALRRSLPDHTRPPFDIRRAVPFVP